MNAEFLRAISDVIRDEIKDPRMSKLCSVTRVEVTQDLKHAKVYVSVYDTPEAQKTTMEILKGSAGYIAHGLGQAVRVRRIPQLHFELDTSIEYSVHISKLIEDVINPDKYD